MRKILLVFVSLALLLLTSCREVSPSSSDISSINSDIITIPQTSTDTVSDISSEETVSGDTVSAVCEHNYSVTDTFLTCVGKGYKTLTCTKCGDSYKETVAAIEHEYKNTEQAPTCTTDGYYIPVCQRCGYALQKQTIAATGHKFSGVACTVCGARDIDKARGMITTWFDANSSYDTSTYGNTYRLPSDNRYYIWANGTNSAFTYLDDDTYIHIQVYGFEKNKCYVTFKKDGKTLDGEFPMDALHSSDRNFFNVMYGDKDLIPILRSMVDGFLLKFESELLKPQINVTLKDIGFSNY